MISVVLLLSRPERLPEMITQYEHQEQHSRGDQRMRLVVVESGAAIGRGSPDGRWTPLNAPEFVVTQCRTPHSGAARNAGLSAVLKRGGGIVCFWDDDDWYGPRYVLEAVDALRENGATVVGKQWHYVDYEGRHLFRFNEAYHSRRTRSVIGPTITVHAERTLPFESRYLDDGLWCAAMRRSGATFYSTSQENYVHRRHSGNYTGHYTVEHLVYTMGEGSYLGAPDYRMASGEVDGVPLATVRPHDLWKEPTAA